MSLSKYSICKKNIFYILNIFLFIMLIHNEFKVFNLYTMHKYMQGPRTPPKK